MKTFIMMLILMAGFQMAFAQNKTPKEKNSINTSFEVKGVCNMCKKRIETAAIYTKGVKHASWEKETQKLTVIYNKKQITEEKIHQNIAAVGHDTSMASAATEVYVKLPGCCRYRDGVKIH
jgi:periplasmic mercuric ion binding protein